MDVTMFPYSKFLILILFSVVPFCCSSDDTNPAQIVPRALLCFNNNFIYSSCEEAYRLDQSGYLNIPPYATDDFCNGHCLAETQLVLNCLDGILSNFIFYNKVTVRDVRYTLNSACSYTSRRGDFNVGDYIQSETSDAERLLNTISLIAGCCISIFYLLMLC